MSSFFLPGRPYGDADLPWPVALFDSNIEPPDPLFDAFEAEMPLRTLGVLPCLSRGRGNGGPHGAPALTEKPRPRPLPPGRPKRRAPVPIAPLVIALLASLLSACGEDARATAPMTTGTATSTTSTASGDPGTPYATPCQRHSGGPQGEALAWSLAALKFRAVGLPGL